MAAVANAPLSAEPANPVERENQNLPPKSYADAVEEDLPLSNGNKTNGIDTNGVDKQGVSAKANGTDEPQISTKTNGSSNGGHKASVLRIVDTGSAQKDQTSMSKRNSEDEATAEEYTANVCLPILIRPYFTHFAKGTR